MEPISIIIWLWLSWGVTSMLLTKDSTDDAPASKAAESDAAGESGADSSEESVRRSLRERLDANAAAARKTDWGNPGWWLRALAGAAWSPVKDLTRAGRWARGAGGRHDDQNDDQDVPDVDAPESGGGEDRREDDRREGDDRRDEDESADEEADPDPRGDSDPDADEPGGGEDERPDSERGERRDSDDDEDEDTSYWRRWRRGRRHHRTDDDDPDPRQGEEAEDYEVEVVGTRPAHEPAALRPPVPALTAPAATEPSAPAGPAPRPEVPGPRTENSPVPPWREPVRPAAPQAELPPYPAGSALDIASPGATRVGEPQMEGTEDVAKYVAIPGANAPKTSMDVGGNTHDDAVDLSRKIVKAVDMTADPAEQAELMIRASLKASWNALDALAAAGIGGRVLNNWADAIIALETASQTAAQLRRDVEAANNAAATAMNIQRKTGDNIQAAVQAAGKSAAESTRYYGKR